MSINSCLLQVGSVEALVVRKEIKNLHLSILPPNGKIRVTAPIRMTNDVIRTLLASRLAWIKKQQRKFVGQARQIERKYISGETFYFLGQRYRLEVVEDKRANKIELKGKTKMILHVKPRSTRLKREEIMNGWYRNELQILVEKLLKKWQKRIGIEAKHWGIRKMKTRWGTCNKNSGRIWLNLELAKKPILCVEYVVVHELLHLIDRTHGEKFVTLLSKYLPKWKGLKDELNRFILSYEKWGY